MKLIVEIPDEQYNRIVKAPRCVDFNEAVEDRTVLIKAIRKATPLDSVKLKIANINTFERAGYWVMIDVLEILNSIDNTESEDRK